MGLGSGAVGLSAQAALLQTGQDTSSQYYADFTATSLSAQYTYNSATATGTFTASDSGNNLFYTDGSLSPGTQGAYSGANASHGFDGSYSLTASIQDIGGNWEVTAGSLSVDGNLLGGATTPSTVLLTANLKTGANTFGYGASGTTLFNFLFTVSGGQSAIVEDFFGSGQGQGAVNLNFTSYYSFAPGGWAPYSGNFTKNFETNPGNPDGQADTFVPEPAAYPLGASIAALMACACCAWRTSRFARRQSVG